VYDLILCQPNDNDGSMKQKPGTVVYSIKGQCYPMVSAYDGCLAWVQICCLVEQETVPSSLSTG